MMMIVNELVGVGVVASNTKAGNETFNKSKSLSKLNIDGSPYPSTEA